MFAWSLEDIKNLQQIKISLPNTKILYKSLIVKNISMQMELYSCEIQPDKEDKEDLSSLVVNKISLWMHNSFKVIQYDDARKGKIQNDCAKHNKGSEIFWGAITRCTIHRELRWTLTMIDTRGKNIEQDAKRQNRWRDRLLILLCIWEPRPW